MGLNFFPEGPDFLRVYHPPNISAVYRIDPRVCTAFTRPSLETRLDSPKGILFQGSKRVSGNLAPTGSIEPG